MTLRTSTKLFNAASEMQAALEQIWKICHASTPAGTGAYTHFMRDFDQIRKLCKPFVSDKAEAA